MATKTLIEVGNRSIALSNLDKPMFPQSGFTKGDLINYYIQVGPYILPHLRDRPITFKRYPDGVEASFFYGKNAPVHTPSWVKTVDVRHTNKSITYVLINDLATLVWSANLATIEMHPYLFKARAPTTPNHIVFDLDPGSGCDVFSCIELALVIREMLAKIGLNAYSKVSGSKGLQLYIPLNTKTTFDVTSTFAKTLARKLEELLPDRVVSKMAKELRNEKIFIDWSQNSKSKTTVCVYSMRAKREVPYISLPFTWEELKKALKSGNESAVYLTPSDAVKRVSKVGDLFEPVLAEKQKISPAHIRELDTLTAMRKKPSRASAVSLNEYDEKRDFTQTSEPRGKRTRSKSEAIFVIQKHQASHLHFDFRLEIQGVLKSWAVPKGPPLKSGERRLAMHVEDHPLDYATFEGIIPKGNYGGGTVMIWDYGTYSEKSGNPLKAYKQGKITVELKGKKLAGEWTVVRDSRDPKRWLLIKGRTGKALVSSRKLDLSAKTERTLAQIASENEERPEARKIKKAKPSYVQPMKATLSDTIPQEKGWIYEIKYDGYRALIGKANDRIQVWSRNGNSFNARFQKVREDAESISAEEYLIDGEIVAQDKKGLISFQNLQNFKKSGDHELAFYAFDILNFAGHSLLALPLVDRRAILEKLVEGSEINLSKTLTMNLKKLTVHAAKMGLEGILAKRSDSAYVPGVRSKDWLKYKAVKEQELVIGGYSIKSSSTFSSLLVGFYEDDSLKYAGKINGGFTPEIRKELLKKLKPLARKTCPFSNLPEDSEGRWGNGLTHKNMDECTWVKPELVCVTRFTEWTENDHLRHGAFVALRDDKNPEEVGRD